MININAIILAIVIASLVIAFISITRKFVVFIATVIAKGSIDMNLKVEIVIIAIDIVYLCLYFIR